MSINKYTIDEVQTFIHCPSRWLFQHYYKVDYSADVEEVYSKALYKSIQFMFESFLNVNNGIEFDQLVIYWSNLWRTTALRLGVEDKEITDRESAGLLILISLYDKMNKYIHVIAVNTPWTSSWPTLEAEIRGNCLAVMYGSFVKDSNANSFYVVEAIPSNAPFRRDETAMSLYHLSSSAIAGEAKFAYRERGFSIFAIDLKTGNIIIKPPINYHTLAPLLKNCVVQMKHLSGIPRVSSHCTICPYEKNCDISIWTEGNLNSKEKFKSSLL